MRRGTGGVVVVVVVVRVCGLHLPDAVMLQRLDRIEINRHLAGLCNLCSNSGDAWYEVGGWLCLVEARRLGPGLAVSDDLRVPFGLSRTQLGNRGRVQVDVDNVYAASLNMLLELHLLLLERRECSPRARRRGGGGRGDTRGRVSSKLAIQPHVGGFPRQ